MPGRDSSSDELMREKEYPDAKPNNKYILFTIKEEMAVTPYYEIDDLKRRRAPENLEDGAPFFFTV